MPIQPCPACRAETSRLLEEVSRLAVVFYYRCDTCGHVWTIHRETREIHHVTPLHRDETDGLGAPTPAEKWANATASWLDSQLRSGLNLIESASTDATARKRTLQQVEGILETVRQFLPSASISREEARDLLTGFHQLDEAVQDLRTAVDR